MNDFDLEANLKSVQVPDRTDEYWDDFPSRVRMQLARTAPAERMQWKGTPVWGWNSGLALACVLSLFSVVPLFHAALRDDRFLQREAQRLSHGMRVLMADQHGMKNLISDTE